MKEKYLPIGTVVTLNNATKKIMIVGYLPTGKDNKLFDYSACTFPEGVLATDKILAFNHNQIKEINFMGLENEETKEFSNILKEMIKRIEQIKQVDLPADSSSEEVQAGNNSKTEINTNEIMEFDDSLS